MRRLASITRHDGARWIFTFGVLAVLFLSSGEGIRLLPFPVTQDDNSRTTYSIVERNLKSYVLSVYNSYNYPSLVKSKSQKHTNQYLPGERLTFDWSNSRANFCLQSARNREEANLSPASDFLSSQSDRAPPTI